MVEDLVALGDELGISLLGAQRQLKDGTDSDDGYFDELAGRLAYRRDGDCG